MPLLETFTIVIILLALGYAAGEALMGLIRKWTK
jgi:hypothetical protein